MPRHIAGTAYATLGHTDLCIMPVPSIFIMGMHDALPTGDFRDVTVSNNFKANGPCDKNWIDSVTKAHDNANNIAMIFTLLTSDADRERYISPFYSNTLYPSRAPSLNITSITNSPIIAPDFKAVSTNLGIPLGPLGCVPTAAPAITTVYIQKEDKALAESTAEILTR